MMMTITFKDVVKLTRAKHSIRELRSVVFDGNSAMTGAELDWVVGVPCVQAAISTPVVVPVDALLVHLAKSRHLVVMPDHLTNGQGLVTPFNKPAKWDDAVALDVLPKPPEGEAVSFDLELDALDRVLIAAGQQDIRYYLNGVLFDLTDGKLVGTDGHRMHVFNNRVPMAYKRKVKSGVPVSPVVEVVLNRHPLCWIVGSASPAVKVTIWNAQRKGNAADPVPALLQAGDGFVWVRNAVKCTFPDWRRVLPAVVSRPVWFTVDPAKLSDVAGAMGRVVHLESGGKCVEIGLNVGAATLYAGKDAQEMPVAMELHSDRAEIDLEALRPELWMGLQAGYLQDVADCVTREAQWMVGHEDTQNQGLLVVDGDFSGVVMNMRQPRPPKEAQEAQEVAPVAQDGPQDAGDLAPEPEPCPAAVDAMAAQLVAGVLEKAQASAKKPPRKGKNPPPGGAGAGI